jgi:hypothetical protein
MTTNPTVGDEESTMTDRPSRWPPRLAFARGTRALVAAALCAGAPAVLEAQDAVQGVVLTADAVPVAGATVTLTPTGGPARTVVTAENGAFAFTALSPGRADLRVRRIGFRAESLAVVLPRADTSALAVRLAFLPQALAPVVVRGSPLDRRPPQIVGFYKRREQGMGRFITRADIESRHPLRTTDLMRMVPGMAVYGSPGGMALRYRNSPCPPELYLDGIPAASGPFDIDAIAPSTIEGIEIYSTANVPVEFRRAFGRASCGTVMLWTRYGEPRPRRAKGKPVTSEDLARAVAELRLYTAAQVDSAARPPEDFAQRVALPDSVNIQGSLGVIAEFVVDAAGRVEAPTINVVASPHPALSDAVRAALPGATFTPAVRAGVNVRQHVQLSVRFGASPPSP